MVTLRCDSPEALSKPLLLNAGPVSMIFDKGDLRYLKYGDREVLRRIYIAVRDQDWDTMPVTFSNHQIQTSNNSFSIRFHAATAQHVPFEWDSEITGDESGHVVFMMRGRALRELRKNRIGFCVLHPSRECAGRTCTVELQDGSVEHGFFPLAISPHQPFRNMRSISHEIETGIQALVTFTGDIFEMEDQRNWTDSTYKTYSTPLDLPFPVMLSAGTEIVQSVEFSLRGRKPRPVGLTQESPILLRQDRHAEFRLPALGLGWVDQRLLSNPERARLRALALSHLRVDLRLFESGYIETLRQATSESQALGLPLELAIFLGDDPERELREAALHVIECSPRIIRWLIFHKDEKVTADKWIAFARLHLTQLSKTASFISGTNAYFAELNRGSLDPSTVDGVCFSISPQIHGSDDFTLIENGEPQMSVAQSAKILCGGKPVHISPVTLRPRFNPNATSDKISDAQDIESATVDSRQGSLLGAAWTLLSIKYLALGGAATATYYEANGPRGLLNRASTPAGNPGSVYPLYFVFLLLSGFQGARAFSYQSSAPLKVDGLVLTDEQRRRILLANLTSEEQRIEIRDLPAFVEIKILDSTSIEAAMIEPERYETLPAQKIRVSGGCLEIRLNAFALAQIDAHDSGVA